jgi:hypothetical protein
MRESLGNEIPDTAPYTEWLAIVGSIVVAVVVCAVLFSNGILTREPSACGWSRHDSLRRFLHCMPAYGGGHVLQKQGTRER